MPYHSILVSRQLQYIVCRKRLQCITTVSLVVSVFIYTMCFYRATQPFCTDCTNHFQTAPSTDYNLTSSTTSHSTSHSASHFTSHSTFRSNVIQPTEACVLSEIHARDQHDGRWFNFSDSNIQLYSYSAFLDNRLSLLTDAPVVRLLIITSVIGKLPRCKDTLSCILYYPDQLNLSKGPTIVRIPAEGSLKQMGAGWKLYGETLTQYIATCPLTGRRNSRTPTAVGISINGSRPSSCMPIEVPQRIERKQDFVVCVPVSYGNLSPRPLIEWLEMQKLLGVSKVFIYDLNLNETARRVFRHYARQGFVEIRKTEAIDPEADYLHKRLHCSASINDCMYRNMHRFNFAVVIDVDELIVSKLHHYNLSSLVKHLDIIHADNSLYDLKPTFYFFRNEYYFLDVKPSDDDNGSMPTYIRYTNGHRSRIGYSSKSIINLQSCIAMQNHFCWAYTPGYSGNLLMEMYVDPGVATSRHYKMCHFSRDMCQSMFSNTRQNGAMDKYALPLRGNVKVTYNEIFNKSPV